MGIMKLFKRALILIVTLGMFAGCYYDNEARLYPKSVSSNCDTVNVKYSTTVLPIIVASCISCHNNQSASGNVNLEGYSNVVKSVNNGALIGSISWSGGFSNMPQGGNKLSDCKIAQVQKWIDLGAKND